MDATRLVAQGMDELTVAVQTLEAYGVTGLKEYPDAPSTAMTQIAVATSVGSIAAGWNPGTQCKPEF